MSEPCTHQRVINAVASLTGIPREEILGPYREIPICNARYMIAWGIMRLSPHFSQLILSRVFGKKTHRYGRDCIKRARQLYVGCKDFRSKCDQLAEMLEGRDK